MAVRARVLFACLAAILWSGCVPAGRRFDPQKIPYENGPVAGRIEVRHNDEPYSDNCYARFFGMGKLAKLELDKDGWLFGSLRLGDQQFIGVLCGIGKDQVSISPSEPVFVRVVGNGRIVYIGHWSISFKTSFRSRFKGELAEPSHTSVAWQLEAIEREYQTRFGEAGSVLTFPGE